MLWLARLLLLRVLPRRLLPVLTVWEVWKIVRGQQAARERARRRAALQQPTGEPAARRPGIR